MKTLGISSYINSHSVRKDWERVLATLTFEDFTKAFSKWSERWKKCIQIGNLLGAQIYKKEIAGIVGVFLPTVYNVLKSKTNGNGIERKEGSGGNGLKRDEDFLDVLGAKIKLDPTISMRRLAKEFNVVESTIRKAIYDDLSLTSYVRVPRHLLTATLKAKRLSRCKQALNWKRDTATGTKHPASIMVLGVVASDGRKMPPFFFKPGEKIGADVNYKVLSRAVFSSVHNSLEFLDQHRSQKLATVCAQIVCIRAQYIIARFKLKVGGPMNHSR
eukprot:snap_masked-scaffold56_size446035-processed-gene-2.0 protein:Tk11493 transcript:snap_masked-scaffold56_size446035-processed-gene-2.0-mRNA-1 annotation:"hypothetical protein X777_08140"